MAIAWSLFATLTGLVRGFPTLLMARFGVGFGGAIVIPGGTALIGASYPEESRAKKLGIFTMFMTIGGAAGAMLGGVISANLGGWRTPFMIFAVPGVVFGVLAFFMQDYETAKNGAGSASHRSQSLFGKITTLLKTPTMLWVNLGYPAHITMLFSILVWGPALLMRTFEIKEDKAGLLFGLVSMLAIVGTPLGGVLADRWQKRRPNGRMRFAAWTQLMASLMALTVLTFALNKETPVLALVAGAAYGIVSPLCVAGVMSTTQDVVRPELRGVSMGLCYFTMYILGGAWGPALVGTLSDSFGGDASGLKTALQISSTAGIVAAVCWWMASNHYAKDKAKAQATRIESPSEADAVAVSQQA